MTPLTLPDLQEAFLKHVYGEESLALLNAIATTDGLTPAQRMEIYRHNTQQTLLDLLTQTFPVTQRMVGENFFEQVARHALLKHPPTQGDMTLYGSFFPDFLKDLDALSKYPYIPDLARLEWLREEAYHADAAPSLTAEDMAGIAPEALESLILPLQPHARLIKSAYPIETLWETFKEEDTGETPDIHTGEHFTLIHRPNLKVQMTPLTQEGYSFLQACASDQPLLQALALYTEEEASQILATFLNLHVFTQPNQPMKEM